jgi:hypothetical protein
MGPATEEPGSSAVWADALFVSALQRCEQPSAGQIRQAVAAAVRTFGPGGCAERVAQEFGDHPDSAVGRMRWARTRAAEVLEGQLPDVA